jgi:hypothetical protein
MTYAGDRTILDADSHVMELADFLDAFIDPVAASRLRRHGMDALRPVLEDAGASAQSRAVAAFCASDRRLLPVGYVPLVDPERAVSCAEEAIGAGCAAVMVPSTAAGERSPTHPDLEPRRQHGRAPRPPRAER